MSWKRSRLTLGRGQTAAMEDGSMERRPPRGHYRAKHHHSQGSVFRSDGMEVGEVTGAGVFQKHLRASRHFLHTPPAICFDLDTLAAAKDGGARLVEVIDTESGTVYRASIALIWHRGFTLDRGYGRQIALPLAEWACDTGQPTDEAKAAQQLALPGMAGLRSA